MRILLVNSHGSDPGYGGAERYVRDLATGLSGRGHDPTVLTAFPQQTPVPGIKTVTLHRGDWRGSRRRRIENRIGDVASAPWPRLGSVLAAIRPDLVHTNNLPGIGTGIWEVARRAGIPCVHTLHDYYLLCPRTSLTRKDGQPCTPNPLLCGARTRRLARWGKGVDRLVAGSEHLFRVHDGLFPTARRSVIRLPLAPLAAPPGERPAELRDLGYLGALTETKGVRVLIEAAPRLREAGIGVRIAGDGPLRDQVEAADVEYAGRLEGADVDGFLLGCDAGIVPSIWEEPSGPPYTVCEWLAAGRPVLASRRGGLAEAEVMGGVVGFEPTTPDLLAAATTLRGASAWREAVESVPAVVDDRDLDRWLDEYEAIYAGLPVPAGDRGRR